MPDAILKPEIIVFAGPNGSGKSTITRFAKVIPPYINADEIKRSTFCSDLEAAQKAEALREDALKNRQSFTFETVLSTRRNLDLLKRAKENGYFIRCIYVITSNPNTNILRVKIRHSKGGHDVPEEKIRTRYERCLLLIPELIETCDIFHLYDNTKEPFRIFKKRKTEYFYWENEFWTKAQIEELTKIQNFISN
ncbi:MAG: zeta toxin family protein [Treponema sp.]|nr:zeta toxin family protein [Treponema sp.]